MGRPTRLHAPICLRKCTDCQPVACIRSSGKHTKASDFLYLPEGKAYCC